MEPSNVSLSNVSLSKITAWLVSLTLFVAFSATVVLAADVLMLIFLGLLFGVFLTHCSQLAGKISPLSRSQNLALVTVLLFGVTLATLYGVSMSIDGQLDKASEKLDLSVAKVENWLKERPAVFATVKKIPFSDELFSQSDESTPERKSAQQNQTEKGDAENGGSGSDSSDSFQIDQTTGKAIQTATGRAVKTLQKAVATTFGLLANIGIIFFVGLFLAIDPTLYRDGFAKLFPVRKRKRITEVMDMMGSSMFRWIIGRFVAMLLTGLGTAIALAVLGVPMPISIGIATGILTFIPNIGSIIALVLASLMALSQGPATVGWVVLAYGAIQLVESNVITPMVQQYQTSIPPALLISFQLVFGVLNGFLGLMIATPLLAALLPLVRELWVKDVLESDE
jgi:predicted PurR-regulated permease PerM